MTEHEMDERFAVLNRMLSSVWNERLPQVTGACAEAYAQMQARNGEDGKDDAQLAYSNSLAELRAYLRDRSHQLVQAVDSFIQEVPCTSYSRIRYMDLLTGEPVAWGTGFDLNDRAHKLCNRISRAARNRRDRHKALFDKLSEAIRAQNDQEAEKLREEGRMLEELEDMKEELLQRPLLTELLRVLQHMDDARAQWEKAPVRVGNFRDFLGPDRFAKVEAAMEAQGIAPKAGKGKNQVVAAFHAACERYALRPPAPGQWPKMLEATYPGSTWSAKCKPEYRPSFQPKGYKEAFSTVKQLLA